MEEILSALRVPGLPKVLRGLPRLYKQQNPSVSKIKPGFDDFETNKRRYLEKLHLREYADKPLPAGAHVVLFTWVMEDGWGDYYTQLAAAEVLRAVFPTLYISLITLLHNTRTLPQEAHPFEQFVILYTGNSRGTIIYEEFSEDVYALLQNASLLLQLPTFFPHTKTLLRKLAGKTKYALIGECGFIDSPWFHPKTEAHCMGLHFLEKGLLMRKIPQIEPQKGFQLDYTKTMRGHCLFFHMLLKALEHDPHDCTIATPSMPFILEEMEKDLIPLCTRYGVSEIVVHFQQYICRIPISNQGKQLTLQHLVHTTHADFLKNIAQTDLLVGCTGDGSIVEAISAGKPFFYDPPPHKRNLLKDLIALAEDRLLEAYPETVDFLKLSLKNEHLILENPLNGWVTEEFLNLEQEKTSPEDTRDATLAEAMGALLQHPRTKEGFKELSRIIKNEYAINETLCHIVTHAMF